MQLLARGGCPGVPVLVHMSHLPDGALAVQHRQPPPGLRADRVQLGRLALGPGNAGAWAVDEMACPQIMRNTLLMGRKLLRDVLDRFEREPIE